MSKKTDAAKLTKGKANPSKAKMGKATKPQKLPQVASEQIADTDAPAVVETASVEATSTKGGMSALDAAARVLSESGVAMTTKELIGVMALKGYWRSPGGKTPHATLYSALMREVNTKGEQSRFTKAAPGRFTLNTRVA